LGQPFVIADFMVIVAWPATVTWLPDKLMN